MRWLLVLVVACGPAPQAAVSEPAYPPIAADPDPPRPAFDPTRAGQVVDRLTDFAFDGGRIEIEMRRDGDRVYEVARNHYAVPIVVEWQVTELSNLEPLAPAAGVTILPAAPRPDGDGAPVALTTLQIVDPTAAYHRVVLLHERFGDPAARPAPYAYRLPYTTGKTFSVLQGFHGAFSHRGSNEYAVDFDCPVATHVVAARDGLVVAANAAAQGSGQTPDFLEYRRTNFVIVLHDDGTLGEYMHLSPSGILVQPGQRVRRGDELALSGNTGFSSTPHLHFQVMTAGDDGRSARSFPFRIAVAPNVVEEPVQGRSYRAWE
ncbi:MAG: peptidoglycan DD-metalloendopeptidase family protein [Acidobacteriota bacterium]